MIEGKEGRLAFTLAHEGGHWYLHRPLIEMDQVTATLFGKDDVPKQPTIFCRSSQKKAAAEWQADRFAAALLMPAADVRATDLLCKVASEEEVLEYCGAFIQLYREEARYLERTAPWIERVGLDYVKSRIVEDADGRVALAKRFAFSQSIYQVDPWAKRAAGEDAKLHQHLAEVRPMVLA